MTDKERVIKGMECCINNERAAPDCMRCPYAEINGICTGLHKLHGDALALLKAQEPVKPVFDAGDGKTIGQFLCGKCHAKIGFGHPHFCWYCGRAVKWE
jgi:hypothetical protein